MALLFFPLFTTHQRKATKQTFYLVIHFFFSRAFVFLRLISVSERIAENQPIQVRKYHPAWTSNEKNREISNLKIYKSSWLLLPNNGNSYYRECWIKIFAIFSQCHCSLRSFTWHIFRAVKQNKFDFRFNETVYIVYCSMNTAHLNCIHKKGFIFYFVFFLLFWWVKEKKTTISTCKKW